MGLVESITGKKTVQFIQQDNGTIFSIECTTKQNHSRKSEPTKFPIEDGNNISDHIVLEPFKLELEGIISDAPLSLRSSLASAGIAAAAGAALNTAGVLLATAGVAIFDALKKTSSPSVAAYAQLLKIQENRESFSVLTKLKLYDNMWITNLSAPRDSATGDSLIFNLSIEQLLIVKPQTVNIQKFAAGDIAADNAEKGKKDAEDSFVTKRYKEGVATSDKITGGIK